MLEPAISTTSTTSRSCITSTRRCARTSCSADRDYIVKDGKVVIIDEFTGRMMEGRRYSEGCIRRWRPRKRRHPAREQTLASITFQNYFRLYKKLAGMTGTAMTEAAEFMDIYKLDVVEMPTNVPVTARRPTTKSIARSRRKTMPSSR